MAVLRPTESDGGGFVHGVGALSLVCLVVALVGIKLKWFKHRLTFNEARGDSFAEVASTSNEVYSASERGTMESAVPQIIRATFRQFDEMDVIPLAELPPVRINNTRPPLRPRSRAPPPPPPTAQTEANEKTKLVSDTDLPQLHEPTSESPISTTKYAEETASPETEPIFSTVSFPINSSRDSEEHLTESINNSNELLSTETDQIDSSHDVGSVSVEILPAHKQEILFASIEDLQTIPASRCSTSSNHKVHLEAPTFPVPPNSPPPRPSILSKPIKFAELQFEENDELHHDDLPTFECSTDQTSPVVESIPVKIPNEEPPSEPTPIPPPPPYTEFDVIKPKRHVTIVTPEVSDAEDEPVAAEMIRTKSTPNLVQQDINRPTSLPLPFVERKSDLTQSNPDLSTHTKSPNTPTKSFSSFFGFLTGKTPREVGSPKKKTKTVRVLKQSKARHLNPMVQQPPILHPEVEQINIPLPMQRKKRQIRQEIIEPTVDIQKPTSPGKSVRFAEETIQSQPVPMQRTILNVREDTPSPSPSPNGFMIFKGEIPGERSNDTELDVVDKDDEDAWDLVARHRQNNAHFVAKQATVVKHASVEADESTPTDGVRQLEMFNRPKTLREMRREQREKREREQSRAKDEKRDHSDTEA